MNLDPTTLVIGVIAGAIGAGYFVYGKNQQMMVPMACGIGLSVYPYFFTNLIVLILIGVVLSTIPFFFRF